MTLEHRYEAVYAGEQIPAHEVELIGRRSHFGILNLVAITGISLVILSSASIGWIWSQSVKISNKTNPAWSNCGGSPVVARARGCHFDIATFSWLNDECYDAELAEQYKASQAWQWFTDADHQNQVEIDVVVRGESSHLFVSWQQHLEHCTYMWKRLHHAAVNKRSIDSMIGDYGHITHCHDILLGKNTSHAEKHSTIDINYPACPIDITRVTKQS
jgi:hypothetical protein